MIARRDPIPTFPPFNPNRDNALAVTLTAEECEVLAVALIRQHRTSPDQLGLVLSIAEKLDLPAVSSLRKAAADRAKWKGGES